MGHLSGKPTNNDIPAAKEGKNQWLEDNDLIDWVALLLNGHARRCAKCKRSISIRYLDSNEHCPDCR
jgi:hypothetical protein